MASIRRFKGDVEFLISEVVADCCTCIAINKADNEKIFSIINDAIVLRNELIDSINHPNDKHNAKAIKSYYKNLRNEMITKVEELFTRLSDCFNN